MSTLRYETQIIPTTFNLELYINRDFNGKIIIGSGEPGDTFIDLSPFDFDRYVSRKTIVIEPLLKRFTRVLDASTPVHFEGFVKTSRAEQYDFRKDAAIVLITGGRKIRLQIYFVRQHSEKLEDRGNYHLRWIRPSIDEISESLSETVEYFRDKIIHIANEHSHDKSVLIDLSEYLNDIFQISAFFVPEQFPELTRIDQTQEDLIESLHISIDSYENISTDYKQILRDSLLWIEDNFYNGDEGQSFTEIYEHFIVPIKNFIGTSLVKLPPDENVANFFKKTDITSSDF